MSRPQVIGPDGKKVIVPSGMNPIMKRTATGILVCTGFESLETVAEREQKNKIQRIRDGPEGNHWLGQLKLKAMETGGDAIFIMWKDTDAKIQAIKTKYPNVKLPVLLIGHDWDYDTKLQHHYTYLQKLIKLEEQLDNDPIARINYSIARFT